MDNGIAKQPASTFVYSCLVRPSQLLNCTGLFRMRVNGILQAQMHKSDLDYNNIITHNI